jgi:hypothetical protein
LVPRLAGKIDILNPGGRLAEGGASTKELGSCKFGKLVGITEEVSFCPPTKWYLRIVSNCPGLNAASAASLGIPIAWKAEFVGAKKVNTPDLSESKAVSGVPARVIDAFKKLRVGSLLIVSTMEEPSGAGGVIGSACGRSLLQAVNMLTAAAMNEYVNNLDVFSFMFFLLMR